MLNMHKALLQLHCRQYHSEKYIGNEIICLRPYTNATEIRRYIYLLTWVSRKRFLTFLVSRPVFGVQPTSYFMGLRTLSSEVKQPGYDSFHSTVYSPKAKNTRSYTSTPSYAHTACTGTTLPFHFQSKDILTEFVTTILALLSSMINIQ